MPPEPPEPPIPIRDPNIISTHPLSTLTSSNVFKWTPPEIQIFDFFIRQYDSTSQEQPLHEILLRQLGFSIYHGMLTEKGEDVMEIVATKVKSKINHLKEKMKFEKGVGEGGGLRRSDRLGGGGKGNGDSVKTDSKAQPQPPSSLPSIHFHINNQSGSASPSISSHTHHSTNSSSTHRPRSLPPPISPSHSPTKESTSQSKSKSNHDRISRNSEGKRGSRPKSEPLVSSCPTKEKGYFQKFGEVLGLDLTSPDSSRSESYTNTSTGSEFETGTSQRSGEDRDGSVISSRSALSKGNLRRHEREIRKEKERKEKERKQKERKEKERKKEKEKEREREEEREMEEEIDAEKIAELIENSQRVLQQGRNREKEAEKERAMGKRARDLGFKVRVQKALQVVERERENRSIAVGIRAQEQNHQQMDGTRNELSQGTRDQQSHQTRGQDLQEITQPQLRVSQTRNQKSQDIQSRGFPEETQQKWNQLRSRLGEALKRNNTQSIPNNHQPKDEQSHQSRGQEFQETQGRALQETMQPKTQDQRINQGQEYQTTISQAIPRSRVEKQGRFHNQSQHPGLQSQSEIQHQYQNYKPPTVEDGWVASDVGNSDKDITPRTTPTQPHFTHQQQQHQHPSLKIHHTNPIHQAQQQQKLNPLQIQEVNDLISQRMKDITFENYEIVRKWWRLVDDGLWEGFERQLKSLDLERRQGGEVKVSGEEEEDYTF
ncbi:hypothetical protein BcDW1_9709 [Botrytis cinerea BcDW1]|uniref:Uncharacterized protein n=1 Tax=Botryotinia fuckeliana (strain BcDW1) TaxID=1290391 RepID=M7TK87_BOTF1|nr:hypothetical protein BcDW1_9709 [Botrytis cinerea BcDW1]